jgi:hypothetical protein
VDLHLINMGIWTDIGILVGILPIPRPEHVEFKGRLNDEIIEKTNYEILEELNGQRVWANDFHHGVIYGILEYNSPNSEKYYIKNSIADGIPLHIHDLNGIGLRTMA